MKKAQKNPAELFAAQALKAQVKKELTENILPYWTSRMCREDGSFHGRIDGTEHLDRTAPLGNIMTARILWTFASAYRILGDEKYLDIALRTKDLLLDKFYDSEFGGTYWALNPDGTPLDTKKQIYAIAI